MIQKLAIGLTAVLGAALLSGGPFAIAPSANAYPKTIVKKCTPGGKCSKWYVRKKNSAMSPKTFLRR